MYTSIKRGEIGQHALLKEKEHFICYPTHLRALMTRKSCAVGMRNAILRNYLENRDSECKIDRLSSFSNFGVGMD